MKSFSTSHVQKILLFILLLISLSLILSTCIYLFGGSSEVVKNEQAPSASVMGTSIAIIVLTSKESFGTSGYAVLSTWAQKAHNQGFTVYFSLDDLKHRVKPRLNLFVDFPLLPSSSSSSSSKLLGLEALAQFTSTVDSSRFDAVLLVKDTNYVNPERLFSLLPPNDTHQLMGLQSQATWLKGACDAEAGILISRPLVQSIKPYLDQSQNGSCLNDPEILDQEVEKEEDYLTLLQQCLLKHSSFTCSNPPPISPDPRFNWQRFVSVPEASPQWNLILRSKVQAFWDRWVIGQVYEERFAISSHDPSEEETMEQILNNEKSDLPPVTWWTWKYLVIIGTVNPERMKLIHKYYEQFYQIP